MQRKIKSYVVRGGRVSNRQQLAVDEWLPNYQLPVNTGMWDLSSLFLVSQPVVVEIGFGMGASLITMAKANPEVNYIGIEVHEAGVGSLVAALEDESITNVKVAVHDAVEVFERCIPINSLAGIQIFFPDPWPKKRHNKRRLIQSDFVKLLTSRLSGSGFLHCATDWEAYALHMVTVLNQEPQLINQSPTQDFVSRPAGRPLTKFEQRGEALGHGVWDLIYHKLDSPLA